jgi:acyl-coenzyme A synthetase/AMP-(fatty) acid ligase
VTSFDALLDGAASDPGVDTTWDDEAAGLYTSGTTGDPKGVHQHRYIVNYNESEWRIGSD